MAVLPDESSRVHATPSLEPPAAEVGGSRPSSEFAARPGNRSRYSRFHPSGMRSTPAASPRRPPLVSAASAAREVLQGSAASARHNTAGLAADCRLPGPGGQSSGRIPRSASVCAAQGAPAPGAGGGRGPSPRPDPQDRPQDRPRPLLRGPAREGAPFPWDF